MLDGIAIFVMCKDQPWGCAVDGCVGGWTDISCVLEERFGTPVAEVSGKGMRSRNETALSAARTWHATWHAFAHCCDGNFRCEVVK